VPCQCGTWYLRSPDLKDIEDTTLNHIYSFNSWNLFPKLLNSRRRAVHTLNMDAGDATSFSFVYTKASALWRRLLPPRLEQSCIFLPWRCRHQVSLKHLYKSTKLHSFWP